MDHGSWIMDQDCLETWIMDHGSWIMTE